MTTARANTSPQSRKNLNDDVPSRLIDTAIALYGERGCHAVSARQIIRDAGVLNEAAIRYYFGGKQGLLRACVQSIATELAPIADEHWQAFESKKALGNATVKDVVSAVFGAVLELYLQHASAVQLLARMMREEGVEGQKLQLEEMGTTIARFEESLAAVLPEASAKDCRLNALMSIYNIINGVVDQDLLNRVPATKAGEEPYQLKSGELLEKFVDYISAGIRGF